jgi:hypothetical protein
MASESISRCSSVVFESIMNVMECAKVENFMEGCSRYEKSGANVDDKDDFKADLRQN